MVAATNTRAAVNRPARGEEDSLTDHVPEASAADLTG
jgi:hypothetical protein